MKGKNSIPKMSELIGKGITVIDGDYESPFTSEKLEAYKKKIGFKDKEKSNK